MEELKLLIGMVRDLPAMAVWLLVIFYGYKVVIVGSIYSVIRFAIDRLHSVLTKPKHERIVFDVTAKLNGMTISTDGSQDELVKQIERLRGKAVGIDSKYIHDSSVRWLRDAIDAKEKADRDAAEAKARARAA